jgi:hypothetical protein
VDKIIKAQNPSIFQTAKSLGSTIQPTVLILADQVIE